MIAGMKLSQKHLKAKTRWLWRAADLSRPHGDDSPTAPTCPTRKACQYWPARRGFAHEINNPLGGIIVFAQMLLREIDKSSPHYQDVEEIENAAQRCKSIVENMLDFARQRPIRPKLEPIDFHAAIENALRFACVGHNSGNRCEVKTDLSATTYEGLGDKNRLIQVILNLCTNALQAMPKAGVLTIRTENTQSLDATYLNIQVSDTGVGIKRDHLPKIFDPFFTTKEPGQGTGLGLSVVHGLILDMGGTIDVESRVKQGTSFQIRLPITKQK